MIQIKGLQNDERAGRNRATAERVRTEYEEDTVGYDEEDTVGYIAARNRLLRPLDCCVFLAASGIGMAMMYLLQGLIICAVVGSNIQWHWTPNQYLASGIGAGLAWIATRAVVEWRDRRAAKDGQKK